MNHLDLDLVHHSVGRLFPENRSSVAPDCESVGSHSLGGLVPVESHYCGFHSSVRLRLHGKSWGEALVRELGPIVLGRLVLRVLHSQLRSMAVIGIAFDGFGLRVSLRRAVAL